MLLRNEVKGTVLYCYGMGDSFWNPRDPLLEFVWRISHIKKMNLSQL